ncbi:MAG: hypothetical protein SP1CHLAM9_11530 [Chlamydiia bacterium]|nr:hypothetical protein [Chlamydiia bacterium]
MHLVDYIYNNSNYTAECAEIKKKWGHERDLVLDLLKLDWVPAHIKAIWREQFNNEDTLLKISKSIIAGHSQDNFPKKCLEVWKKKIEYRKICRKLLLKIFSDRSGVPETSGEYISRTDVTYAFRDSNAVEQKITDVPHEQFILL